MQPLDVLERSNSQRPHKRDGRILLAQQNVLRAKGYLAVKGKPMRLLVQSVGERVRHQFDKPWGAGSRQSKLVVIGEHGDIEEAAIRAGLGI